MEKKSKPDFKIIVAIICLLITMFSTISFATDTQPILDVIPPRGKLEIQNIKQKNNINYIDGANVTFKITAFDDVCNQTEIKYYYSLSPISNTTELTTWYDYIPGKIENITLTAGENTIYAIFKDPSGNTSLSYGDTGYTIKYNKNADDAVMFLSTVDTTPRHGMPFILTMQTPTRDGYYFAGWSTDPTATEVSFKKGEIIPTDTFVGGGKEINLYAVWAQSENGKVLLADVAEIGDYVNYPVYYDNIGANGRAIYNGWRVISKNVDLDNNPSEGTVNLVSAGTPLAYNYSTNSSKAAITDLTTNFLTTEISSEMDNYYTSGFSYNTLTETFTNKFTAMKEDGVTPKVRAMKIDDTFQASGYTTATEVYEKDLKDAKYEELFANDSYYYLASAYNNSSYYLYVITDDGKVTVATYRGINGIRPVVSLKSEVIVTGRDKTGAWNIDIQQ